MDLSKIIITDVPYVLLARSIKGRTDKLINRPCYGVSFTNEGVITYRHNGKAFVSDKNHAVILPKGQSYSIQRQVSGEFAVLNFECKNFFTDTIIVLPIKDSGPVMTEFLHMKKLSESGGNQLMLKSYMYKILHQLTSNNELVSTPLSPALAYIEKNYASDISNKTLAQQCSYSEEYFRKQFKKTYGISPKQHLIDIRINKAKQLLSEGRFKTHTISAQCGFSNPYHFSRIFKAKTGLTPTEYASQNKIYNL